MQESLVTELGNERLGAFLKRERELRGLSLEDVVLKTKIQRSYLEAIERDDFTSLPPGPFIKGFISSYAKVLGVKPEALFVLLPEDESLYVHKVSKQLDMISNTDISIRENLNQDHSGGTGITIAVIAVVILGLGTILWSSSANIVVLSEELLRIANHWQQRISEVFLSKETENIPNEVKNVAENSTHDSVANNTDKNILDNTSKSTSNVISEGASVGEQNNTDPLQKNLNSQKASSIEKSNVDTASIDAKSATNTNIVVKNETKSIAVQSGATNSNSTMQNVQRLSPIISDIDKEPYDIFISNILKSGNNVIELVTQHKSYLKISSTMGGPPIYEDILKEGESKRLEFPSNSELWMVFGNIGGVSLTYNNEKLPQIGRDGERRGVGLKNLPSN